MTNSDVVGLEWEKIKTEAMFEKGQVIRNIIDLQEKISEMFQSNGEVVAYIDYKVLIGTFEKGKLFFYANEQFEPKYLQKLRVFNKDKEIYLWRTKECQFNIRARLDGQGYEKDIVDADQVIWGTKEDRLENGWSKIYEERGMELIVPFLNKNFNEKSRAKIKTRNYIDYNDLGQAGYVDCRFLEFVPGGE
ncbi:MAG: TIGR03984 family CRISPR-associated protein [Clostridiales bacterium]|nr:TIGR03984 family CRISPR-associated protein [Clostridiales bacterium]MCF8021287.1 TIGR03984 family CRISPR-associated protein [Clostridiales bacterium]